MDIHPISGCLFMLDNAAFHPNIDSPKLFRKAYLSLTDVSFFTPFASKMRVYHYKFDRYAKRAIG